MEQSYTQENLIQFIYRENTITDHFEIENAIDNCEELRSTYKEIKTAISALPKVSFFPSKYVIENILLYSHLTTLEAQY